ncbi:unnamed protein product [Periconia digitata]|uniref:NACHT domain-containing protein n=1 Tax=Periconia digitata TaxID=1303443 RepID=A0A9W4UL28_9PLEO|nr:unnamed protein product [Periconia digitata]
MRPVKQSCADFSNQSKDPCSGCAKPRRGRIMANSSLVSSMTLLISILTAQYTLLPSLYPHSPMEALVAVGLAGNVVQFVQFSGQLIAETSRIRQDGSPSSLPGLLKSSEKLITQTKIIFKCLKSKSETLTEEDQHLIDTSFECERLSRDFMVYLNSLVETATEQSPSSNSSGSRKSAIKASIRYRLAHHKIDAFISKLQDLRSTLLLSTTLALRGSANSKYDDILLQLEELRDDKDKAEILQTTKLLENAIRTGTEPKLDMIQAQMNECLARMNDLRKDLPQLRTREKAIIDWLDFPQMTWRYEEVPLAYRQTYRWIFETPDQHRKWNNFKMHLSSHDVAPYFINGKAGSGKSTLMKFTVEHPETRNALLQWAGNHHSLLQLNFFFWHLGSSLQKNVNGLLRSLLHRTLTAYPDLIPAVFPKQYQTCVGGGIIEEEPRFVELKRAFDLVVIRSSKFLKICIFVDGLDEFESDREGDQRHVAEWLRSLAENYEHVKVIVSSRPLNVFLNIFLGCPTLKLQDLTRNDMHSFIQGNLESHRGMAALAKRFPREADELISEIRDKAQGVFLWVKIVVRILIEGLEAGDDYRDLQHKLRSLPPDIRDLYQRMFAKMQPEYRVQAAKIFQLLHSWKSTTSDPFTTTDLYFSLQNPSDPLRGPHEPVDASTMDYFHERTEPLIRSRCCGLLEVYQKDSADNISKSKNANIIHAIDYLHRTVAEFLITPDIWSELQEQTRPSGFDPYHNLIYSTLSVMRTGGHCLSAAENFAALVRKAPELEPNLIKYYTEVLGDALNHYRHGTSVPGTAGSMHTHWSAILYSLDSKICEASGIENLLGASNIFTFAARQGLVGYLREFCSPRDLNFAIPIYYALDSWMKSRDELPQKQVPLKYRRDTLLFVLENYFMRMDSSTHETKIRQAQTRVQSKLAERMGTYSDGLEAYALFASICLVTSKVPERYMRDFKSNLPQSVELNVHSSVVLPQTSTIKNPDDEDKVQKLKFFLGLSSILQRSDDPQNRSLGQQMEQITLKVHEMLGSDNEIFGLGETREKLVHRGNELIKEELSMLDQSIQLISSIMKRRGRSGRLRREYANLQNLKFNRLTTAKSTTVNVRIGSGSSMTLEAKPIDRLMELEASGLEDKSWLTLFAEQNGSTVECMLRERVNELTLQKQQISAVRDAWVKIQKQLTGDLEWILVEA